MNKAISIEYGEDVVVVVKRNENWTFYVGHKDLWIMDQYSWAKSYVDAGYNIPLDDHSERFDIALLDESTADDFFDKAINLKYSTQELSWAISEFRKNGADDSSFYPSLFLDFDAQELTSYFPENFPFEKHLPKGWKSKYQSFLNFIPKEYHYW